MNTTWILVYSFLFPTSPYFNQPIIMDHFNTKQNCEATLEYIHNTYLEAGIAGKGHCWGEE